MDGHQVRQADKTGHGCNVADEVVVEFFVEGRIDHVCEGDQKKRVAVWRCSHDGFGPYVATGPRPILNYERLAEPLRQPLSYQACHDVGATSGGKADDYAHGPARIGLRPSETRGGRQRGRARCQMQKLSAGKFHWRSPP